MEIKRFNQPISLAVKQVHSQSGQVLVSFVIMLPLLLAAAGVTAAGILFVRQHMRAKFECRTSVIAAENILTSNLTQLLALNPLASALRIERQIAEQEVKIASANPPALALATAHLASVVARQMALAARQRALIIAGNTLPSLKLAAGTANWRRTLSNDAYLLDTKLNPMVLGTRTWSGFLSVEAKPIWSITPDYYTKPDQSEKSLMRMMLAYDPKAIVPEFLLELVPKDLTKISIQCRAVAQKENFKWISRLSADKPSLNWL